MNPEDPPTESPHETAPASDEVPLPNLNEGSECEEMPSDSEIELSDEDDDDAPTAADLEAVFDVPVKVSAVLGKTRISISDLVDLRVGEILPLDRRVGEAIDIFVNNRLIARGEVVMVEDRLAVTMTEIIKAIERY